jgi:hypothetical protein
MSRRRSESYGTRRQRRGSGEPGRVPHERNPRPSSSPFGDRPKVGHGALDPGIRVRVLVPEPRRCSPIGRGRRLKTGGLGVRIPPAVRAGVYSVLDFPRRFGIVDGDVSIRPPASPAFMPHLRGLLPVQARDEGRPALHHAAGNGHPARHRHVPVHELRATWPQHPLDPGVLPQLGRHVVPLPKRLARALATREPQAGAFAADVARAPLD